MDIAILIANILTLLAFILHTFVGDKELKVNEPTEGNDENFQKREKWTMARCGWHWVSFDLLFATIGLGLINFTNHFDNEKTLLQILTIYFLSYAIVWALTIAISKKFPKNYLKLALLHEHFLFGESLLKPNYSQIINTIFEKIWQISTFTVQDCFMQQRP